MTRTQVQQLIVVLLLLFVVVWIVTRKAPTSSPLQVVPGRPTVALSVAPSTEEPPLQKQTLASSIKELSLPRDIFQPPPLLMQRVNERHATEALEKQKRMAPVTPPPSSEPPIEVANFELQGIFWGIPKPQAIINRQILSVGDKINNAEVEAITKDGVTLSVQGQRIELKALPPIRSMDKKQGQSQTWSTLNLQ